MFISGIALLEQKLCFTTTFRVFLFKKGCNMNLKGIIFLSISGILSLFLFQSTLFSQPVEVPFGSGQWDMSRAQVIEHLGRTAIKGNAMLRDIRFTNGIIEVDIATTERTRAYPGVLFRVQDPSNYERVYIRPHRSPFYSDALQYAPVFHGVDSWQLYNGPGKTCALDILPDQWNHLKIVVSGTRAEVFWNGNKRPDLTIGELAHGDIPGTLGLNGGMDSPCFFSGFSYLINDSLSLSPSVATASVCGIIENWEISESLPLLKADLNKYPEPGIFEQLSWKPVNPDETGLVDISRYYPRKSRSGDYILARSVIIMEKDTVLRVGFGYSDYITVFLNTIPLYSGNSAYRSRDPSFLGIVGYFDVLFLPLKKGSNELLLLVGETMGGWAFSFRKEDEIWKDKSLHSCWTEKGPFGVPESAVYDAIHDVCYISNYFNEGNEYISKISVDGKILEQAWITGVRMPTGMCILEDTLYVVDRSGIQLIDILGSRILRTIQVKGAQMINDVAIDARGNLYITDTPLNRLYRYSADTLETILNEDILNGPNGLLIDGNHLLIGQNEEILKLDLTSRAVTSIAKFEPGSNIDGIQSDGRGNYLVSDYGGKLYRLTPDGNKLLLLNTSTPGLTLADFSYIPGKKRLIIPTLYNNSVVCFELK
jgi:hypothetical protein